MKQTPITNSLRGEVAEGQFWPDEKGLYVEASECAKLEEKLIILQEEKASLNMTVSMQSAMIDEYKRKNADLIKEISKLEDTVDRLNEELC